MMDEEMSVAELLVQKAEENQTRKIIDILNEAEDLEDAKETVKALLIK
ncbi:protein phosphatase [Schaedlerella arabinosiphila]|uniref:Protein phosphatase n=2 Tax=Schaedlerella arabinosiphila TaxID=2044587 RepID=A0A3R8L5N6_9FIRM|nr:protein phosphatase [Schaedlerella arabinosiphila]